MSSDCEYIRDLKESYDEIISNTNPKARGYKKLLEKKKVLDDILKGCEEK